MMDKTSLINFPRQMIHAILDISKTQKCPRCGLEGGMEGCGHTECPYRLRLVEGKEEK